MALFNSPESNRDNPPESWVVVKHGRRWWLTTKTGGQLDTFTTKREAEAAKLTGFLVNLWNRDRRWFAGETIPGLKTYAQCLAERM